MHGGGTCIRQDLEQIVFIICNAGLAGGEHKCIISFAVLDHGGIDADFRVVDQLHQFLLDICIGILTVDRKLKFIRIRIRVQVKGINAGCKLITIRLKVISLIDLFCCQLLYCYMKGSCIRSVVVSNVFCGYDIFIR